MSDVRLSVHLMVRDAAGVVGRAIRSAAAGLPVRELEVCYVDTGSTDDTPEVIRRECATLGVSCSGVAVSPTSRPDLFFRDVPGSYGCYQAMVPSFTRRYYLRDWAAARNLGLELCRGRYVLKLDADDELVDPANLPAVLDHLDREGREIMVAPYEVMDRAFQPQVEYVTLQTRIWRRDPGVYFREVCHENVDWRRAPDGSNWVLAPSGFVARDHRDAQLIRDPYRNYKVLLREYASRILQLQLPSDHLVIYLADEAAEVSPELANDLCSVLEAKTQHPTDEAWVCAIRARAFRNLGARELAMSEYARSAELGFPRSALLPLLEWPHPGDREWEERLRASASANAGGFYPLCASRAELRRAREYLGGDRG